MYLCLKDKIVLGRILCLTLLGVVFALLDPSTASAQYTWKNVVVPAGGYVSGVNYSPVSQGLIYMRTDMGGAYRWDNANNVWVPLTDWLSDWNLYGIESIVPDPKNANVVYAAVGQNYNGTNGYILASTNQGNTWNQYNIGVVMGGNADGRNAGERLAVDPNLTSKLYFGSRSGGLWVSTNSAVNWAQVGAFPTTGAAGYGLSYVIFDPHGTTGNASQTIYVGVSNLGSGNSNLYRSVNGGTSWAVVPGGPVNMATPHASLGTDGILWINYNSGGYGPNGITSGQIWKLNTATLGWTNVTPAAYAAALNTGSTGGFGGISVDAQNPQHVVASTLDFWSGPDKTFSTTNAGAAWTTIGAINPGYGTGPFMTYNNNGALWTRFCGATDGGSGWAGDIKIDPFNSNNAIYTTGGGVWTSTNTNVAAVTWTFTDYGLEETAIQDFTTSVAGGVLFSSMGDIAGMRHTSVTQSPPGGMWCNPSLTTNTGIDFAQLNTNIVVRVGQMYGATQYGAYSTNNGQTWTAFGSNAPGTTAGGSNGLISVNANGSVFLWSPPGGAPVRSTNNGTTWLATTGLPNGTYICSDRANSTIFYGVSGTNLYVSNNSGASFTVAGAIAGGLSWDNRPRAVFGIAGEVWVPTGSGLYRFTNVGLGAVTTTKIANITNANAVGFGKAATGNTHPAVYMVGIYNGTYGFYRCDDGVGTAWTRTNDAAHQFGGPSFTCGDELVYGRQYLGTNGRGILYGDMAIAGTPTFTSTPTSTSTATATRTSTPTSTVSTTATRTASPTFTASPSPTSTVTPTRTMTPTQTATSTLTRTSTSTSTPTQTLPSTATSTRTNTATNSPTSTNSVTATPTPTMSSTSTATRTSTGTFTATSTSSATATSSYSSTTTRTSTATPTSTSTPTISMTATPSSTPSSTATVSWSPSSTPTSTSTRTSTLTPTLTGTSTWTGTPTNTGVNTSTVTATPTSTSTRTSTPTLSATLTSTSTGTPTNTGVNTSTVTATPTSTSTRTSTPTSSATLTFTSTGTPTNTGVNTSTMTATPTSTSTRTSTPTTISTSTGTPTSTVVNTNTATSTFTATSTRTSTQTATWSSSATPSRTLTVTSTWSSTATSTGTTTPTNTNTSTPTVTPTSTVSSTSTWTSTGTQPPTNTQTWTPTSTVTETNTGTSTSTSTDTPTTSVTASASPTRTSTSSATPTASSSPTESPTESPSASPTFTLTETLTSTPTQTLTSSSTPTASRTASYTSTPSATPTETSASTSTSTWTSSFTVTSTPTSTLTSSPTATATWSPSNTSTTTCTVTPVFTATATSTSTLTTTATATGTSTSTVIVTATPTETGPCGTVSVSAPYPNPVNIGPVHVRLESGCLKRVTVAVFSSAYRKIQQWDVDVLGTRTTAWDLTDSKGAPVSPGLYHMVFTPQGEKRQVKTVVVLR